MKLTISDIFKTLLWTDSIDQDELELKYEDLNNCNNAFDWAVEIENCEINIGPQSDETYNKLVEGLESGLFEQVFLELVERIEKRDGTDFLDLTSEV